MKLNYFLFAGLTVAALYGCQSNPDNTFIETPTPRAENSITESSLFNKLTNLTGPGARKEITACKRALKPSGTQTELEAITQGGGKISSIGSEAVVYVRNEELGIWSLECRYIPMALEVRPNTIESLMAEQEMEYGRVQEEVQMAKVEQERLNAIQREEYEKKSRELEAAEASRRREAERQEMQKELQQKERERLQREKRLQMQREIENSL